MGNVTKIKVSVKEYEGADRTYNFWLGIDYTGISDGDLRLKAAQRDKIPFQQVCRNAGAKFMAECEQKGTVTVHYTEVGKKIVSDDDRRKEMVKQIMLLTSYTENEAKGKLVAMLKADATSENVEDVIGG